MVFRTGIMIEIFFLEIFLLKGDMWFRRHDDFEQNLSDLCPQRSEASSEDDGNGFVPTIRVGA